MVETEDIMKEPVGLQNSCLATVRFTVAAARTLICPLSANRSAPQTSTFTVLLGSSGIVKSWLTEHMNILRGW